MGGGVSGLLEAHERSRTAPQPFEVVELALLSRKEVDDHVLEVEKYPARLGVPFLGTHFDAGLFHLAVERIDQGVHLAYVARGGDHEVIGER